MSSSRNDAVTIDILNDAPSLPNHAYQRENTAQAEGWLSWSWRKGIKPAGLFVTSLATSIPSAVNALVAETNANPKEIVNPAWWRSLTPGKLTLSLANTSASLVINVIMNMLFFPLAAQSFIKNIKEFKKAPTTNIAAILLGLGGAVGAATIAYDAFLWFPGTNMGVAIASAAALFNFSVYVATRYVGASKSLQRLASLLDPDHRTQQDFADKLNHLNPEYQHEMQTLFNDLRSEHLSDLPADKPLNISQIEDIVEDLATALSQMALAHPNLIQDRKLSETFVNGTLTLIDLVFAVAAIGAPAYLTFMQAGFKGVNKVSEVVSGQSLNDLNDWAKRGIGFVPGLASGLLYGISALELRTTIVETAKALYQHPTPLNLVGTTILCVANALSNSSMFNVATSIVEDPHNLIFMNRGSTAANIFIGLNATAGVVVNTNTTFKKAYLTSDLTPENMTDIKKLSHYLSKPVEHAIGHETADYLRRLSLFQKDTKVTDAEQVPLMNAQPTP